MYRRGVATTAEKTARLEALIKARQSGAASVTDADGTAVTLRPGPELDAEIYRLRVDLGLVRPRPKRVLVQVRRG